MRRRLVVLETNEIPLRVFQHYAKLNPQSSIAALINQSLSLETQALDVEEELLYPSQSWASFNMGTAYEKHNVRWYNDPKPSKYPLYWKVVASQKRKVGLVGTLHSSPAADYASDEYAFLVPDCFANDDYASPSYLQPFQAFNLKMTKGSGRVSTMKLPPFNKWRLLFSLPKTGITLGSYLYCAKTVWGMKRKKIVRERMRVLQFPLIADIFMKQLERQKPDLAILFTNHVAANLHRYWYALFPEDYEAEVYGPEWCQRYGQEIIAAMDLTNRYVGKLMKHCDRTGATLMISSSMGQGANNTLPERVDLKINRGFRLDNVRKFVSTLLETTPDYDVESAMVPQYTLRCQTVDNSKRLADMLDECLPKLDGLTMDIMQNEEKLTMTIRVDPQHESIGIGNRKYSASDLGFTEFPVEDHHSGHHVPDGALIIYGSETAKAETKKVNFLEYAPAVLNFFDIDLLDHMRKPSFSI